MNKNQVLMRDVICLYHPEFVKSADLRRYGLKHSEIFNIERLVEESLAAIGPYDFVDSEGYDFSDFSDSKTTTVNISTGKGTIGSIETKIGALRITAFNPIKEATDFFFVPASHVPIVKTACYGVNSHKERIQFAYSKKYQDHYGYFEKYRVANFEELALS
jgi:hypothetical protein